MNNHRTLQKGHIITSIMLDDFITTHIILNENLQRMNYELGCYYYDWKLKEWFHNDDFTHYNGDCATLMFESSISLALAMSVKMDILLKDKENGELFIQELMNVNEFVNEFKLYLK